MHHGASTPWRAEQSHRRGHPEDRVRDRLDHMGGGPWSGRLAAGYDSETSFAKAFKRVVGVAPGAMRSR